MRSRLFIIVVGLLLASCGGGPSAPRAGGDTSPAAEPPRAIEPIERSERDEASARFRVALLLPLSGPQAELGEAMLQAAQMALFDIGNPGFVLMPRDAGVTADSAGRAAERAVADGAQIILGPIFSRSVEAAGAVARRAGVPLVGFSNDSGVAGRGVFLTGFAPVEEVRRIVQYAAERGYGRQAALIPETPYGDAVASAFRVAAAESGADPVRMVTYPPQDTALQAPVRRLARYDQRQRALQVELADLKRRGEDDPLAKRAYNRLRNRDTFGDPGFRALLIPEGGGLLRALMPLLPYYDIDPDTVKFIGTSLWDDSSLTREPPLHGAWFAAPPTGERQRFEQRFRQTYGTTPPYIATLAYDGMALAASLGLPNAQALGGEPLARRQLENANGFRGVDGIFRFRSNGLVERGLAVKEITPSGIRVISPAPTTFETVGF